LLNKGSKMAFFQNLFDQEYQGSLLLADRKLAPTFRVPSNKNFQSNQVAWNPGPYDFSSLSSLEFNFSWDPEFKNWSSVSIDLAGADPSNTSAQEVVGKLNSDPIFSSLFMAKVVKVEGLDSVGVVKNPAKKQNVKMYFGNYGAQIQLGFNKRAGVAELPEYFARHTIQNRSRYEDSVGMLIRLDENDPDDQATIEAAGFTPGSMKADWELLRGRGSGLFTFQKLTVDGSDRITQIIEYPAGALEGDFARKIQYEYAGSNKNPSQITEIPYVLEDVDMVSPPA
jgi:hypothetical protein